MWYKGIVVPLHSRLKISSPNRKKSIIDIVDDEDKLSTQIKYAGQKRSVTVINESGLYSLILSNEKVLTIQ